MKIDIFTIGPVTVHGYGLMIAIGILVCLFLGMHRAKKYGLNEEAVVDIAIAGVVCGFLGAKLLFLIVEWKSFLQNPKQLLGSEGFVVYGGIITGVLAAIFYCKKKKLRFLSYFDLLSPSIAVAQGFGRLGCFMAGCCYGRETTLPIGVVFPANSLAPTGVRVLPTQLFSSLGNFLIMAVLLWHYSKRKKVGDTGFLYLLLYGTGRFAMEFLRADRRGNVGFLTTSQFIAVFMVAGALWMLFGWKNRIPVSDEEKEWEQTEPEQTESE